MTKNKKKKRSQFKIETNRIFWFLGIFIVFIFFSFTIWGEDGLMRLWELKDIRNQISKENKNTLLENLASLQEIENLKESRYVEQIARSELGMIREDEVILVIPQKKSDSN